MRQGGGVVNSKYASYDEVVFYRKAWVWGVLLVLLTPVAVVIGLSGELYSQKDGQLKVLPRSYRLPVCICFGLLILFKIIAPMVIDR